MTATETAIAKTVEPLVFRQSEQAVKFTRPDAMMFNRVRQDAPVVDECSAVVRTAGKMSGSLAASFVFDSYATLVKHRPEPSGMGDPTLRELVKRVQQSPEYPEVRAYTVADDAAATLAACSLAQGIAEKIPEEVKKAAEQERKARAEAQDAEEYVNALLADPETPGQDVADAQAKAKQAAASAEAAGVRLRTSIKHKGKEISAAIAGAAKGAKGAAQAAKAAEAFGFGSGSTDPTGGLPMGEKFRLAKIIQGSGPAFMRFVEMLGRLSREALQKQADRMRHEAGEIVDVTLGSDLPMVMEDELVSLLRPGLRLEAMARFADDSMRQYEVEQKEPLAKGDVVVLIDESGSMSGQKEAEAKAVALALGHVCARQKRRLVVLFFQSSVTERIEIKPGDADATENGVNVAVRSLGRIAARGTGGGTSFDAPLLAAVEEVTRGGMAKADVLMVTDGICDVDKSTLDAVNGLRVKTGARVYSVLIGDDDPAVLRTFSDRVWKCRSMLDGVTGELFGQI